MNMHEYNERVKERNRVESEYNNPKWQALTDAYLVMNLHKDLFCKIVDAIGYDEILKKANYFMWMRKAQEDKQRQEYRARIEARRQEIDAEIERLQEERKQLH